MEFQNTTSEQHRSVAAAVRGAKQEVRGASDEKIFSQSDHLFYKNRLFPVLMRLGAITPQVIWVV